MCVSHQAGKAAPQPPAAAKGRAEKPLSPWPHPRIMTTATPTRRCCCRRGTSASASARADGRGGPPPPPLTRPHSHSPPLASPTCAPPPRATFRFRFPLCIPPHRTYLAARPASPASLGVVGGFGRDGGVGEKSNASAREGGSRAGQSAVPDGRAGGAVGR